MKESKTSSPKTTAVPFSAAMLVLFATCAGAHSGREPAEFSDPLVGTWKVQVATYNCATGVANPPFDSLLTFAAHGTMSGTTANPVFLPGQRSSEQGLWRKLGENYFISSTEAFIEFASVARGPIPPFMRGSQRIDQAIELTSRDSFTSEATLTFFDENETVVASGCAKATAKKLRF